MLLLGLEIEILRPFHWRSRSRPPPLPPTAGPPTNVAPPKGKPAPPPLPLAKDVPPGEAESKTGRPSAGEKASPPKPPQRLERSDCPSKARSSSRTGDRSTEEVYTPFFQETEIDWGSDDDRTEAEKKEDEELLRKTQESVLAFLKAPPDLRRALRTQAWKNCCSKLAALRCDFDTPPEPETHAGKFEADLQAGFSYAEAKLLQKARVRAARHHQALARMKGASIEDMPKSWMSAEGATEVLTPGFLERKREERNKKTSLRGTATGPIPKPTSS